LWRKALPGEPGFKTAIRIFNVSSDCIVEDQEFLKLFLPASQARKLRSDVRGAFKFLYSLSPKRPYPSKDKISYWADTFDTWQKKLTPHHVLHQDKAHEWHHLGMSLHYLLDGLYHIFAKFLYKDKRYRRCSWCSTLLRDSWTKVLSRVVVTHTLASYVHLCVSYSGRADEEIVEQAIDDMLKLVKMSLQGIPSKELSSLEP